MPAFSLFSSSYEQPRIDSSKRYIQQDIRFYIRYCLQNQSNFSCVNSHLRRNYSMRQLISAVSGYFWKQMANLQATLKVLRSAALFLSDSTSSKYCNFVGAGFFSGISRTALPEKVLLLLRLSSSLVIKLTCLLVGQMRDFSMQSLIILSLESSTTNSASKGEIIEKIAELPVEYDSFFKSIKQENSAESAKLNLLLIQN